MRSSASGARIDERKKLHLLFETARSVLHVSCFYDDEVNPDTLEVVLGDAQEFIRSAERLAHSAR